MFSLFEICSWGEDWYIKMLIWWLRCEDHMLVYNLSEEWGLRVIGLKEDKNVCDIKKY